jgi:hypothetical protein
LVRILWLFGAISGAARLTIPDKRFTLMSDKRKLWKDKGLPVCFQVGIGCLMHCFSFRSTGAHTAANAQAGISHLRFSFGKTYSNQNSSLISPLKTAGAALCFLGIASDSP